MEADRHTLPRGAVLEHYRIEKVLGEGGFGITYLAVDLKLDVEVVIKEYFPTDLAVRGENSSIHSKSNTQEIYLKGLKRFKEEAKTLAQFNHPSIVKILNYFEANDTAYFVMEYEEGIDLGEYLKAKGILTQEEILSIMMPILEGLKEVHAHHYLHRDIKPGNILIRKNHSPVLIDFGASKQLVGEVSKSVTSLLTEGYAPPEQYGKDLRQQAPCTDIYAIGAVIYKMITRHVPVDAITRVNQSLTQKKDPYQKLTDLRPPGYDFHFLKAVDRALALDCNDRPRDVSEFQKELLHPSGSSGRADTPKEERPPRKRTRDPRPEKERKRFPLTLILLLLAGGGIGLYLSLHPTLLNQRETPPPSHPSAKARERSTQHTRTPVVTFSETPKASRGEHVRETRSSVSDTSAADTEEKRCARGDRLACYRLGRAYFQGSDGKLVDYRQAKKFLTRACRQREYRACALLGELHEKGLGTPRDYSLAFSLYDRACNHGVGQGCDGEGYLYFRGEGVRKDLKKAFESYRRSCEELNYEKACVNLGYMYEHGYGVEEDPSKAYLLYYRACRQGGIVGGCVNLGVLKEKLAKTKEDYLKAFRLYREACEKGNGRGCTNMALLYRDGKGVAKDPAKARELLTRACKDLLDPLACRRLNAMEQ